MSIQEQAGSYPEDFFQKSDLEFDICVILSNLANLVTAKLAGTRQISFGITKSVRNLAKLHFLKENFS